MSEPELVTLEETATAVIRAVVPMAELVDFFDRSFTELMAVLGAQGVVPAGPPFARYAGPPGEMVDLEVGFPLHGTVTAEGQVRPGALPAGRVASVVHIGPYDQLGESWGRLNTWIAEQGLTPGADVWEVYVTEPTPDMDPADLRTELFWAVQ